MTGELKLVRTYDGTADIDTLNLLDYTDGIDVAYDGWIPKVPTQDETEVLETLTLRVRGTSHDDLASKLQRIAQFSEYARWYRENSSERYGVWLRAKLSDESESRQTFVHNIDHAPAASIYSRAVREESHVNNYLMQLRRVPYWEGTTEELLRSEGDLQALNQGTLEWVVVGIDSSNQNVYACVDSGDIYKQTAGDGAFAALSQTSRAWSGISIDSSNHNAFACVYGGDVYKQTAGTGNFVGLSQASRNWNGISADDDNHNVYACVYEDGIYKQTAGTGNFSRIYESAKQWTGISVNSSTKDVYACASGFPSGNYIYKQTGGTGNFEQLTSDLKLWQGISVDSVNGDVYACNTTWSGGDVYKQTAGVGDFVPLGQSQTWADVAIDSTTKDLYAAVPNNSLAIPPIPGDIYKTLPPPSIGATYSYANVQGDVPARISYVGVDGVDSFGVGRFWLGFRSNRFGDPGDFRSWYAFADEPGVSGTIADPMSYGGTSLYSSFSGGTPAYFEITPSKHGIDINQQNGSYLVLARVYVYATEAQAQFRMRMYVTVGTSTQATSTRYYSWVPVFSGPNASGWGQRYYEMGVISIPVFGRIINGMVPDMTNLKIGIEAYRTSGVYWFFADGIVLIPIAEGLVKSSLPSVPGTVPTVMDVQQAIVTQTPEGAVSAYETDGTYITRVHDVSMVGGVPPGDGVIVFAADNMFGGSPDYKATLLLKRKTRWKELAGSEQ